jgi:hypothetical protein
MTSMKPGHDQYIKLNDQSVIFHDHPLVTKPHWSYITQDPSRLLKLIGLFFLLCEDENTVSVTNY